MSTVAAHGQESIKPLGLPRCYNLCWAHTPMNQNGLCDNFRYSLWHGSGLVLLDASCVVMPCLQVQNN